MQDEQVEGAAAAVSVGGSFGPYAEVPAPAVPANRAACATPGDLLRLTVAHLGGGTDTRETLEGGAVRVCVTVTASGDRVCGTGATTAAAVAALADKAGVPDGAVTEGAE